MFKYVALEGGSKNNAVEVGVFTDDGANVLLTSVKAYNQAGPVKTNQEVVIETRPVTHGPQNAELTHNLVGIIGSDPEPEADEYVTDEDTETVSDYGDIEV